VAKAVPERQGADEELQVAIRRLLKSQEKPRSLRWLAREMDREVSFLSRALRGADGKAASPALLSEIAATLRVDADWFAGVREAKVIESVREDSQLRERLFEELKGAAPRQRR
jgi:transcriptional regulator with XRE-family HTH domain